MSEELISLREFLEAKITSLKDATEADAKAQREAVKLALDAAEKAAARADATVEERLRTLNEFRSAVDGLISNCPTRAELKALEEKCAAWIRPLETYVTAQTASSAGQARQWTGAQTLLAAAVALVALYAFFAERMPQPPPMIEREPPADPQP